MLIIACLLGSFPVVAAYPCTDNEFELANYQLTSLQVATATLNKRPVFNPSARPTEALGHIQGRPAPRPDQLAGVAHGSAVRRDALSESMSVIKRAAEGALESKASCSCDLL